MCSIGGSFNKGELYKILDIQEHRAPDGKGVVNTDSGFYMGMGRLAIIDLISGNLCPHVQEDGNLILSYNGEVYNYLEIRQELKNIGYKFNTDSDTEVVLTAYKEWGVNSFNKFNGMFAIAIYDGEENTLVLARDIAGQKPLFYRTGDFAFASEAKALKNEDSRYREDVFFNTFQHIYEGTLWSNIKQVKPAHYLKYDLTTKNISSDRYWSFKKRFVDRKTVYEELEYLIKDSINLIKRSDVPLALYYSGGVDSSIIRVLGGFEDNITFYGMSEEDFNNTIDKVVHHLDFPVGSFSSAALYQLASIANKKGFKVVVSGEGADEVFGGYIRYVPIALIDSMYKRYPSYTELFNKFHKPSYVRITKRTEGTENYLSRYMKPFFDEHDPLTAMQLFDFTYILPSLLQMGDRMSSAFGLENRCPFLDKRIIEFGLSLPPDLKIKNMETKVLLRRLLNNQGLSDLNEEKVGLVVPFNEWNGIEGYERSTYFNKVFNIWKKQNSVQ